MCLLAEDDVAERTMAVAQPLLQTQQAFDEIAARYDRADAQNRPLCAMRERAWRAVDRFVPAGSHVLDLGCGPGSDAVHLARGGSPRNAGGWARAVGGGAREDGR